MDWRGRYYLALFELTLGQYRRIAGGVAADHYTSDETQPLVRVPMDTFRGQAASTPANLTPVGVFTSAPGGSVKRPARVGCYPPNPWGFYDMHGNVWEMVRDRWVADTGTTGHAVDPCYAAGSASPVAKGGSYDGGASRCRSAARTDLNTSSDYAYAGFRLALTLED